MELKESTHDILPEERRNSHSTILNAKVFEMFYILSAHSMVSFSTK